VQIAPLLREWRQRRRLSREELARAVGVSARELAHVETGRERPSRELLLALADGLGLPARERDGLLSAAGLAPPAAGEDEPAPAKAALKRMLERHEPFPALAVDREWTLVAANTAWPLLTHDVAPALLEPPVNVVRLALHPAGLARHVLDLEAWRALTLERLRRAGLDELASEIAGYPEPERTGSRARGPTAFLAARLRSPYGTLTFLPAVTTFPTAVAAGMAELTVVALHPVDSRTRAAARAAASRPSGR
jgi:transcriptional regulator with XRE-family HTH domain